MSLAALRKALHAPTLQLQLRREWSASQDESRLWIRRELSARYGGDHSSLEQRPSPAGFHISVSHCQEAGGFASVALPQAVGFDVELHDRVSVSVAKRVSTAVEFAAAPSPGFLWAAKEAAFKSLTAENQPATALQIAISNWRTSDQFKDPVWLFSLQAPENPRAEAGYGAALRQGDLVLALFCF